MTMAAVPALLLLFIFHLQSEVLSVATPSGHDSRYMDLVSDATHSLPEEEYDYIVVGGGTAGCPLAATLSENYKVLILERGGVPLDTPNVLRIEGFAVNLLENDDGTIPAQKFTSEDGVENVRGRVLGGTSMINAGFYSRGNPDYYKVSGIDFDMDRVEKAYEWVEKTILYPSEVKTWSVALKDALLEAKVGPDNGFTVKHIPGTKVSASTFDASGRRHGSVEHLNKANPKNLRVAVHATVQRIIFSSSTTQGANKGLSAIGVIYSDSNGKTHRAMVRDEGEVILSAGSIGSPQLLLLSGVGPHAYLQSLHIPVVHDLPFVGRFVTDIPRNNIQIVPPIPMEICNIQVVGIEKDFYIESFSVSNPVHLARSSILADSSPHTDLHVATILEKLAVPLSKGTFRLVSSTEASVSPIVKFNYFENPIDLAICVTAMRRIGELLKTKAMDRFKFQDVNGARDFKYVGPFLPANQSDDAAMGEFCRKSVTTIWHYHGGCNVGKVVDGDLRVLGINALRVVDGSTLTVSPGTNPHATLMMLGRYTGLKIMEERTKRGQSSSHPEL